MLRELLKKKSRFSYIKYEYNFFTFILFYAFFSLISFNYIWLKQTIKSINMESFKDFMFFLQLFITILSAYILIYFVLCFKYTTKFICIILLIINSLCSYFMIFYGAVIDKDMLNNVIQTNFKESLDLLSSTLAIWLFIFVALPSFIIIKAQIKYKSIFQEMISRAIFSIALIVLVATITFFNFQKTSIFIRTNNIGQNLVPRNYITAIISLANQQAKIEKDLINITDEIKISESANKLLTIVIVGETARKHNFSLYGYTRQTNKTLQEKDLFIMNNTTSCWTSTAISLPCMFSHLNRSNFLDNSKNFELLPRLLNRSGVKVFWKDNNSGGCKGVCNDVEVIEKDIDPNLCPSGECVDGILLKNLKEQIKSSRNKNTLVILHQNGSHGPRYYKRYPKEFEIYKPICNSAELKNCSREELINTYDNTIVYTDHFISQTINFAKNLNIPASVIYMSDHGESLGENGLYLHGFPYAIAPKEQKEIPFLIWLSHDFFKKNKVNKKCVTSKPSYSHDNLFHTVLGLFNVTTPVYDKSLDIFSGCIERI